jgi:hypothetical protein
MTGATTKMENPMPLNTGKTGESPTGFGAANKSTDHENALDGTNPKSHEFPSSATKYAIVAKSIQEIDATTRSRSRRLRLLRRDAGLTCDGSDRFVTTSIAL